MIPSYDPDDDLTGESFTGPEPFRAPLPWAEQTRRVLMGLLGAMFAIVTALLVTLALLLDPKEYQPVAAVLAGPNTVLAAALGGAILYYFTRREP